MANPADNGHSNVRIRRRNEAWWASHDLILADGEPGYDLNLKVLKVGDGVTPWSILAPVSGSGSTPSPGEVPVELRQPSAPDILKDSGSYYAQWDGKDSEATRIFGTRAELYRWSPPYVSAYANQAQVDGGAETTEATFSGDPVDSYGAAFSVVPGVDKSSNETGYLHATTKSSQYPSIVDLSASFLGADSFGDPSFVFHAPGTDRLDGDDGAGGQRSNTATVVVLDRTDLPNTRAAFLVLVNVSDDGLSGHAYLVYVEHGVFVAVTYCAFENGEANAAPEILPMPANAGLYSLLQFSASAEFFLMADPYGNVVKSEITNTGHKMYVVGLDNSENFTRVVFNGGGDDSFTLGNPTGDALATFAGPGVQRMTQGDDTHSYVLVCVDDEGTQGPTSPDARNAVIV